MPPTSFSQSYRSINVMWRQTMGPRYSQRQKSVTGIHLFTCITHIFVHLVTSLICSLYSFTLLTHFNLAYWWYSRYLFTSLRLLTQFTLHHFACSLTRITHSPSLTSSSAHLLCPLYLLTVFTFFVLTHSLWSGTPLAVFILFAPS